MTVCRHIIYNRQSVSRAERGRQQGEVTGVRGHRERDINKRLFVGKRKAMAVRSRNASEGVFTEPQAQEQ